MLLETWGVVLRRSYQDIWLGIVEFVPALVVALIIFVVGWFIGVLLGRVVAQIIRSIKVDNALKTAGVEDLLSQAGFRLDSGKFIGELVKWFIIVVFLVATLDVLGLKQVNIFLQDVVLTFIPQVIVAALILLSRRLLLTQCRSLLLERRKRRRYKLLISWADLSDGQFGFLRFCSRFLNLASLTFLRKRFSLVL